MTMAQQLTILEQGVRAWNTWRTTHPTEIPDFSGNGEEHLQLTGACLNGINLRQVNFCGVNLGRTYLNEADFREAQLREANLSGAHLIEANFGASDLQGATLDHAYLMNANLCDANASDANFNHAHLRGVNFSRANLARAQFHQTDLRGVELQAANLEGAYLTAVSLSQKRLQEGRFANADFSLADLSGVDLQGADLHGANFRGASLKHANLRGAELSAADFHEADLTGADLHGAILRHTDFREAILKDVNLCGAELHEAIFDGHDLWRVSPEYAYPDPQNVSAIAMLEMLMAQNITIDDTTIQSGVIIHQSGEPLLSVDRIEIAQLIYLLLNQHKIRSLMNVMTSKVVLVLGRFTGERADVLAVIRGALRKHGYFPVLFDFESHGSQNFNEMISTLAQLARFVIADFTDASLAAERVPHIIRNSPVPIQPLLAATVRDEPRSLANLRKDHAAILETYRYVNSGNTLEVFENRVISPAEAKVRELRVA